MNDTEFLDKFDVPKPRENNADMVFYGLSAAESGPAVEIAHQLGFKWFAENFAIHKKLHLKTALSSWWFIYYYSCNQDHLCKAKTKTSCSNFQDQDCKQQDQMPQVQDQVHNEKLPSV